MLLKLFESNSALFLPSHKIGLRSQTLLHMNARELNLTNLRVVVPNATFNCTNHLKTKQNTKRNYKTRHQKQNKITKQPNNIIPVLAPLVSGKYTQYVFKVFTKVLLLKVI